MFDYEQVIDALRDMKKMSGRKRRKTMKAILFDDDFIRWIFQPTKVANLTEIVGDLYAELSKPIIMEAIVDVVRDEGYSDFSRSHAVFFYSIANIAIQGNNDLQNEIRDMKRSGEMSTRDAKRAINDIKESNEVITELLKCGRKIIRRDAKRLANQSRLPRYITIAALTSVPDYEFVDHFKIGFYLNNLFNTIYSDVNDNGDFDKTVKWKTFFREVFGKDNVVEVATYILLEGVHRIDKYENSEDVHDCWDSLTSFALKELNDSPTAIRDQMMELYLKRLSKMFKNKAFDLRVDLKNIDKDIFPNLANTITKYTDKLMDILSGKK